MKKRIENKKDEISFLYLFEMVMKENWLNSKVRSKNYNPECIGEGLHIKKSLVSLFRVIRMLT
jgi:hypothetical protein